MTNSVKTVAVSELIGLPLDWAVSNIEEWGEFDENGVPIIQLDSSHMRARYGLWSPSTLWEHGGPIIEREKIDLCHHHVTKTVSAMIWFPTKHVAEDTDPLIAAMRCYVASKLGDTIEVPDELLYENLNANN